MRTLQAISPRRTPSRRRLVKIKAGLGLLRAGRASAPAEVVRAPHVVLVELLRIAEVRPGHAAREDRVAPLAVIVVARLLVDPGVRGSDQQVQVRRAGLRSVSRPGPIDAV